MPQRPGLKLKKVSDDPEAWIAVEGKLTIEESFVITYQLSREWAIKQGYDPDAPMRRDKIYRRKLGDPPVDE